MRRIVLPVLGLSLLACSGILPGGKDDTDTTVVTDTTSPPDTTDTTDPPKPPTGDTGPNTTTTTEPPPDSDFVPFVAFMSGTLTWEASTSSLRSVDLGGGTMLPTFLEIVIGSRDFLYATGDAYALTDEYCVVDFMFADGPAPQSALDTATTYRVVDHSGDAVDVVTTCDPAAYPMDAWLGSGVDLVDTLLNGPGRPWAIGVGQMTTGAADDLEYIGATTGVFDFFVGGRAFNAGYFFSSVIEDDNWAARGFRVDPITFEPLVDVDGYLVPIPAAQVSNGTNLATGWYDLFPVFGVLLQ